MSGAFILSLLVVASLVLCAISSIAIICKAVGCRMEMRHFFIWVALFVISFALVMTFGYWGTQDARKQSKKRTIEYSSISTDETQKS
jgi:hypothetical protein